MSFFKKAREVTGDLAAASKRQAQRGKLEIDVRRLESKASSEKDAIGQALFPLLDAGTLLVDAPEVQEHLKAIKDLQAEIAERRAEIDALREPGEPTEMKQAEPAPIAESAASAPPVEAAGTDTEG